MPATNTTEVPTPLLDEMEKLDLGFNFSAPLEQVATAFLNYLTVNRQTMSQDNRDRVDAIGIGLLEITIGKLIEQAKKPQP